MVISTEVPLQRPTQPCDCSPCGKNATLCHKHGLFLFRGQRRGRAQNAHIDEAAHCHAACDETHLHEQMVFMLWPNTMCMEVSCEISHAAAYA